MPPAGLGDETWPAGTWWALDVQAGLGLFRGSGYLAPGSGLCFLFEEGVLLGLPGRGAQVGMHTEDEIRTTEEQLGHVLQQGRCAGDGAWLALSLSSRLPARPLPAPCLLSVLCATRPAWPGVSGSCLPVTWGVLFSGESHSPFQTSHLSQRLGADNPQAQVRAPPPQVLGPGAIDGTPGPPWPHPVVLTRGPAL